MTILAAIASFLMSTIGRYLMIAAAVGGLLIGVRQIGYNAAMRKCDAATKQRALEIMQKDLEIGRLQAKEDERISTDINKAKEIDDAVQAKLEAELAKRKPADRCPISDADARRLR